MGAAARADCDFGTLDLLLRISGCGVFPVCVEGAKLGLRAVLWEARPLLLQFMFKPCQGKLRRRFGSSAPCKSTKYCFNCLGPGNGCMGHPRQECPPDPHEDGDHLPSASRSRICSKPRFPTSIQTATPKPSSLILQTTQDRDAPRD